MKKTAALLFSVIIIISTHAQVQRKRPVQNAADTASAAMNARNGQVHKKDMLRELNLTKQQKLKLKEMRQAGKAKMDEIQNDTKLSETEKKTKIRELKKAQMENTLSVLNDEQKAKFKQLRKENKDNGKDDMTMEEQ